jgi:hypothetical protein
VIIVQSPPPHFKRGEIFEMVKDLRVVFGKGDGSELVPHDANGRAPMWKNYILGVTLLGNS